MCTGTASQIILDPAAQAFVDSRAVADCSPISTLSPSEVRAVLDRIQSGDTAMPPAEVEPHTIPGGPDGEISITVVRSENLIGRPPVVLYFHGGGWVLGNYRTHERLVRELAVGTEAAIVFVNYSPSPEAPYPVAIEEAYAATQWVAKYGADLGLDGKRLAVAGDGAGGALAAEVTLLARERRGPSIRLQALFYPVTNAAFDTGSYREFAEGYGLTRKTMQWCWDQYVPDPAVRFEPTASPLLAAPEQLVGLPPALVITAEADVVRDEGEAYARTLHDAGIDVTATRYDGIIHDFMMLNALAETTAARDATTQATRALKVALAG